MIHRLHTRNAAVLVGISLLVMALAAGIAYGAIHSSLIDVSDPTQTLQALTAQKGLFTVEILLWVIIIVTDLLVTWGVWSYFTEKTPRLAAVTAIARGIYTFILIAAVMNLVFASTQIGRGDAAALVQNILMFEKLWSLGLIVFGIHLVTLASASCTNEPKVFGVLLFIAGISYVLVHTMLKFAPSLSEFNTALESVLSAPMAVGELAFGLWLLIRGGKRRKKAVS